MGRNHDYNGEDGLPERENPYKEFEPAEDEDDFTEDYDDEAYDDARYTGSRGDEFDEDEDDAYSGYRSYRSRDDGRGILSFGDGSLIDFVGTVQGKILLSAIALLLVILIGLVVWQFTAGAPSGDGGQNLPTAEPTNDPAFGSSGDAWATLPDEEEDHSSVFGGEPDDDDGGYDEPTPPASLVFSPAGNTTDDSTPEETPLPIILSNTPTPEPSATPTPAPTATPEPTASPVPSPTPEVIVGTGKTNREANVRRAMNGKVIVQLHKGQGVNILEVLQDKSGDTWYLIRTQSGNTTGYVRDYLITLDEAIAASASEAAETKAEESATSEPTATPAASADVIGTGKTNREANVRRAMNGKVIVQLRKGRAVNILEVLQDKSGDTWYRIRTQSGNTTGYVRDYVITLDKGVELPGAQSTAAPQEQSDETASVEEAPQAEATLTPQQALLEREVIGRAKTNREANVRAKPDGKVARQLSKGVDLLVLEKFNYKGNVWYEVCTTTGRTHGFVRDYVINVTGMDKDYPAKEYAEE